MSTDTQDGKPASAPQNKDYPRRFAGKVALVTGVSDKGIGGAIARRLAAEGAAVSLTSLEKASKTIKRIERNGGDTLWTTADITRSEDIQSVVDATMEQFGQIDVLVNNAGIELYKTLELLGDEDWQSICDVNLSGVLRMSRAALPYMPEGGSTIINIASALGLGGCTGFTAYSATKAGVIGFTRSLAMELAPRGNRCVAIAPAVLATPMSKRYLKNVTMESWQKMDDCHALGVGLPEDVAATAAFLASQEARWITGITIPLGWCEEFPLPHEEFME